MLYCVYGTHHNYFYLYCNIFFEECRRMGNKKSFAHDVICSALFVCESVCHSKVIPELALATEIKGDLNIDIDLLRRWFAICHLPTAKLLT